METEIKRILTAYFLDEEMTLDNATKQILLLLGVVGLSEQLPCERCKKMEFMIDNGLGWKDMENDCT